MADKRPWLEALTPDEIRELRKSRPWRTWLSVGTNLALIAGAMALVAWQPNPLTVIAALLIIGTRQLGFAIIMHEASHRTLFANRKLNDWVGAWLGAYPVLLNLSLYRPYHLQHHAKNWTKDDPDLSLADKYPVGGASMARKLARDLLGITGVKRLGLTLGAIAMAIAGKGKLPRKAALQTLLGAAVTNGILFTVLFALGHPLLYLLWAGAWLTTHSMVVRVRSIAEHSMVPDTTDELKNTRTIRARWWERLLIAPNQVQFHLEHHLLMTVPHYNLPRMHRMLTERGALEEATVEKSYVSIVRRAASGKV